MSTHGRTRGLTLVEVMVALALSGIVVLGARVIVEALGEMSARLRVLAAANDGEANAERLLRSLVERIETGTDAARPFRGADSSASFTTWCRVGGGWQERCRVDMAFTRIGAQRGFYLATSTGLELVLRPGLNSGEFRYLASARNGGVWYSEWRGELTPPLAVEVRIDADTLVLRIGERG